MMNAKLPQTAICASRVVRKSLLCTGWPKKLTPFCTSSLYQILTDYQNYFTIRIRRKFVIILSLKIPPHLNCVATLTCEMSSVLKATIEKRRLLQQHILRKHQQETTRLLSQLSSKVTVTSCSLYTKINVQCVRLAAGRRTQAGDTTDRWHHLWPHRLECVVQHQGGVL